MLKKNSPAIDSGIDLPSPYNLDKDGTLRPRGNGFDLGAYEYHDSQHSKLR